MSQTFINTFFSVKLVPSRLLFTLIFMQKYTKQKLWGLRLAIFFLLTPAYYYLWEAGKTTASTPYHYFVNLAIEMLFFVVNVQMCKQTFHASIYECVYYSIMGWTLERSFISITTIIGLAMGMEGVLYRDYSLSFFLLTFIGMIIVGGIAFIITAKFSKRRRFNIERKSLILPIQLIFFLFVFLNGQTNRMFMSAPTQLIILRIYDLAVCILLFFLLFYIFDKRFECYVQLRS